MKATEIKALADALRANIAKVVVGKEDVVDKVLAALLAGGHVLLEDASKPFCAKSAAAARTMFSRCSAATASFLFS